MFCYNKMLCILFWNCRMWSIYWKTGPQLGCPASHCWWWRGWIWQLPLAGKLQSLYITYCSSYILQVHHPKLLSLGLHPNWVQSVWWISRQPLPRCYSWTLCCKVVASAVLTFWENLYLICSLLWTEQFWHAEIKVMDGTTSHIFRTL
jgi:hypothetical protein